MSVQVGSELKASISDTLSSIVDVSRSLDNLSLDGCSGKNLLKTRLQSFLSHSTHHPVNEVIYELIMTQAFSVERQSPGSLDICIRSLSDAFSKKTMGDCIDDIEASLESTRRSGHRLSTITDVHSLLMRHDDKIMSSMILQAINLAGFCGNIAIEKTLSQMLSVELVSGHTFGVMPMLTSNTKLINPRVGCIDGYVENVSELHFLLEEASASKIPVVLFVRGMSDDVLNTLKTNNLRGSFFIEPICVAFDVEGVNTIVDIAVVCGCDVVSSNMGDNIGSLRFNDLKSISSLTISGNKLSIINSAQANAVAIHAKNLSLRRLEKNDEALANLLDKRIKSLMPNHVIVRLPDDEQFVVRSQLIDHTLRSVRSMTDYGVTNEGKSYATEILGRIAAIRCMKMLANLGAVITV